MNKNQFWLYQYTKGIISINPSCFYEQVSNTSFWLITITADFNLIWQYKYQLLSIIYKNFACHAKFSSFSNFIFCQSVAMVEECIDLAENGPVETSDTPAPGPKIDPTKMAVSRSRQMVTTSGPKPQGRTKTPTRKK